MRLQAKNFNMVSNIDLLQVAMKDLQTQLKDLDQVAKQREEQLEYFIVEHKKFLELRSQVDESNRLLAKFYMAYKELCAPNNDDKKSIPEATTSNLPISYIDTESLIQFHSTTQAFRKKIKTVLLFNEVQQLPKILEMAADPVRPQTIAIEKSTQQFLQALEHLLEQKSWPTRGVNDATLCKDEKTAGLAEESIEMQKLGIQPSAYLASKILDKINETAVRLNQDDVKLKKQFVQFRSLTGKDKHHHATQMHRQLQNNFSTLYALPKMAQDLPRQLERKCEERILQLHKDILWMEQKNVDLDQSIFAYQDISHFYRHCVQTKIENTAQILNLQLVNRVKGIITPSNNLNALTAEGREQIATTFVAATTPYSRWTYWFSSRNYAKDLASKTKLMVLKFNQSFIHGLTDALSVGHKRGDMFRKIEALDPKVLDNFTNRLLPAPQGFSYRWSRIFNTPYHRDEEAKHARQKTQLLASIKLQILNQKMKKLARAKPAMNPQAIKSHAKLFSDTVLHMHRLSGKMLSGENMTMMSVVQHCHDIGTVKNPLIQQLIREKQLNEQQLKERKFEKASCQMKKENFANEVKKLHGQLKQAIQNSGFSKAYQDHMTKPSSSLANNVCVLLSPPKIVSPPVIDDVNPTLAVVIS